MLKTKKPSNLGDLIPSLSLYYWWKWNSSRVVATESICLFLALCKRRPWEFRCILYSSMVLKDLPLLLLFIYLFHFLYIQDLFYLSLHSGGYCFAAMAYAGWVGGPPASDAPSVSLRRGREQGLVSPSQGRELPMQKIYSSSNTERAEDKNGERTEGVSVWESRRRRRRKHEQYMAVWNSHILIWINMQFP